MRNIIASIEGEYRRFKGVAEAAFAQLDERQLTARPPSTGNSVATIGWHIAGNLRSRFTEFLTSDGDKPWRDRESEFVAREVTHQQLLEKWESGWRVLFESIASLSDDDLQRTITIRGVPLTVCEALHRSLAHTSYHIGQIVFWSKSLRGADWKYLSIPPGQSEEYKKTPTLEKAPKA